jgi:integrase
MTHAAKRKWCSPLILERPKVNGVEVRWLKPEEAERLIAACSKHFQPLVIFLLYTGARAGEALWLDWRNVNLSAMHASFPKTKNGEARGVPLHPRVVATLANLKGREGEVFRRPDGEPYERPDADDEADTSAGAGSRRRSGPPVAGPKSRIFIRMPAATLGPLGITPPTVICAVR